MSKELVDPPRWVQDLGRYVPGAREEQIRTQFQIDESVEIVKLASNENPYGPSPKVLSVLKEETVQAKSLYRYPDDNVYELTQALSAYVKRDAESILVEHGSSDLILSICRALLSPNDTVLLFENSFPIYELAAQSVGAKILKAKRGIDFKAELKNLKALLTKDIKLIFIGNPDNPTGQALSCDELAELVDFLPKETVLVIDEAYHEIVFEKQHQSSLEKLDIGLDGLPNVCTIRSFSKAFSLAGLRVGYGVFPRFLASQVRKVIFPFAITSLGQKAATTALSELSFVHSTSLKIAQEKIRILRQLEEDELLLSQFKFIKGMSNFYLLRHAKYDSKWLYEQCASKGVIVRPLKGEAGLSEYVRVSVGLPYENDRLLHTLEEIAQEQREN